VARACRATDTAQISAQLTTGDALPQEPALGEQLPPHHLPRSPSPPPTTSSISASTLLALMIPGPTAIAVTSSPRPRLIPRHARILRLSSPLLLLCRLALRPLVPCPRLHCGWLPHPRGVVVLILPEALPQPRRGDAPPPQAQLCWHHLLPE
jgi:hypothetical protein